MFLKSSISSLFFRVTDFDYSKLNVSKCRKCVNFFSVFFVLLTACEGGTSSADIMSFKVNFKTFNFVYAPLNPISIESEYNDEIFGQELTLNSGIIYGMVENKSLLIQYESFDLPAYEVLVKIVDQNLQLPLAEERLNVKQSTGKQLVFAIGDKTNVDDSPRLKIFNYPDFTLADGEVGMVVINLRNTTKNNSKYNLEIDSVIYQRDLEYAEISNVIKITGDKAVISVNDNFGSDSKTCFLDFSVLPYSWQMNDWMLVFDISNKEKCYLVSLTTTAIVEMEYNS